MKLYESLYIFLRYKQDINFLFELIIDFAYRERKQYEWNLKDEAHYVTMYNAILMHTCSKKLKSLHSKKSMNGET